MGVKRSEDWTCDLETHCMFLRLTESYWVLLRLVDVLDEVWYCFIRIYIIKDKISFYPLHTVKSRIIEQCAMSLEMLPLVRSGTFFVFPCLWEGLRSSFFSLPRFPPCFRALECWLHGTFFNYSRLNGIDNIIQDVISSYLTHTDIVEDARSPYPHRYCQGCDTFLSLLILSKMWRLGRRLGFVSSINLSSLHH